MRASLSEPNIDELKVYSISIIIIIMKKILWYVHTFEQLQTLYIGAQLYVIVQYLFLEVA